MSLFEVVYAEVSSLMRTRSPFVKVSKTVNLSPIRAGLLYEHTPAQAPRAEARDEICHQNGELIMQSNCTGTVQRLRRQFLGLAALVNFFDVAASRRAASKSVGLHSQLYDQVFNFVDYDT